MGKGRDIIQIGRNVYDRTMVSETDTWDKREHYGRSVHIVRIFTNEDDEVVCARIYGTDDEVERSAEEWTNGLLRANPGKFLRWVASDIRHDSIIRRNTESRDNRIKKHEDYVRGNSDIRNALTN